MGRHDSNASRFSANVDRATHTRRQSDAAERDRQSRTTRVSSERTDRR